MPAVYIHTNTNCNPGSILTDPPIEYLEGKIFVFTTLKIDHYYNFVNAINKFFTYLITDIYNKIGRCNLIP